MTRPSVPVTQNQVDENMANHLAPFVGNFNQVPLNKKSGPLPTEQQVHDIPDTSQPAHVISPTDEFTMGDIREELQRRVHIIRQQEIQRQVDQILEKDRLARENKDRLAKVAARTDEAYVPHLKLKFPTAEGIWEISCNQKKARMCYQTSVPPLGKEPGKAKKRGQENHPEVMSTQCEARYEEDNLPKEKENLKIPFPHEEVVKVPFVKEEPKRTFRIGTTLDEKHKESLVDLIRENNDIFPWEPEDMSGIDTSIALHKLHVDSIYVPIKQKKRTFNDQKNQAVMTRVELLLKANAIREL